MGSCGRWEGVPIDECAILYSVRGKTALRKGEGLESWKRGRVRVSATEGGKTSLTTTVY